MVISALGPGIARIFYYPTLFYTLVRARLPGSQRPWFNRIDRAVVLGALPLRGRCRQVMKNEGLRDPTVAPRRPLSRRGCSVTSFSRSGCEEEKEASFPRKLPGCLGRYLGRFFPPLQPLLPASSGRALFCSSEMSVAARSRFALMGFGGEFQFSRGGSFLEDGNKFCGRPD